jgi:hypothetical protein
MISTWLRSISIRRTKVRINACLPAQSRSLSPSLTRAANSSRRPIITVPFVAGIQASGATSLRQIAAALNERHIRTAQGKEWTATQVMRVLGQEKAPLGSL